MLRHWYPLTYTDANGETHVWEPPFPGAPRRLAAFDYLFASSMESLYSHWVTEVDGLELPPALVRHTRTNPFRPGAAYEDNQIGFHPPLRPGVNVVWAAGVDLTDLSLRLECPVITTLEVLSGWTWPTLEVADGNLLTAGMTYDDYLAQMNGGYPPSSGRGERQGIDTGTAIAWSDQYGVLTRETRSTPYGWYTFDIETLRMRPVDTAPDSWDTINLWFGEVPHALGEGSFYHFGPGSAKQLPLDADPWPPFDPWTEVVLDDDDATTRPGFVMSGSRAERYFESVPPTRWGHSEYMRITCQ
ncbi:MAG: hypothetical protein F4Y57_01225 [Acidobacteria bacterium]|nr:hypothetical protein [Acidobacteriota bacterium]